ncbi:glycosyltransferase family 39 protein [Herpetosiphon sp. NSE202]|uniref:glycosyltransferase family 39 protein n=1 Tax=Herpetosiphon sp. NSE202 TaxID=3351349 RepID=UPI00363A945D
MQRRIIQISSFVAILGLCLAITLVWVLQRNPAQITIGGKTDSPWLVEGFQTKERSELGAYRWTNGHGIIGTPATHTSYMLGLTLVSPVTTTLVQLNAAGHEVLNLPISNAPRYYQIFWQPDASLNWLRWASDQQLSLSSELQILEGSDQRALGVVLQNLSWSPAGRISLLPFAWITALVVSLTALIRPQQRKAWLWLAAAAVGASLIFGGLTWLANDQAVWWPIRFAPSLLILPLAALALLRWPWQGWRQALPVFGLIGIATIVMLLSRKWWLVQGPDFGWHSNHGSSAASVFRAHPFYPLGFPLILWLGLLWDGDQLAIGQTAGFISILITLILTALIAYRILALRGALLALVLALATPLLLAFGVVASSDSVQLPAFLAALLVLLWQPELSKRRVAVAGLLLGVAYLFRFQSIVMMVLVLPWLLLQALAAPPRWPQRLGRLFAPALLVAGFVLGSAPQWVLDIRDTGRPFFSQQYENIWQAAYNRVDPVVAAASPEAIATKASETGLYDIVAFDPYGLFGHWQANLSQFFSFTLHTIFIWPFGLLMLLGLGLALLKRADARLSLLAWLSLCYIPIIALTWNKDRFYLPIVPLLLVLGAYWLEWLRGQAWRWPRGSRWLAEAAQAVCLAWALSHLSAIDPILRVYGSLK